MKRTSIIIGLLTLTANMMAAITNAPDSVWLFSYSNANGNGGLHFAWSADGEKWASIGNGYTYVSSDFGPWGVLKKMYKPHLVQTRSDNQWHCIWELTDSHKSLAYVKSPNLLQWRSQVYFDSSEFSKTSEFSEISELSDPKKVYPTYSRKVLIKGQEYEGWAQRVAYSLVQSLEEYAGNKAYRASLYDERTEQDAVRFAGLKPVKADISVDATSPKEISDHFIGIFFEDINYGADGGLYAELIQNRDFEYSAAEKAREKGWDTGFGWNVDSNASLSFATTNPIHKNNPHYAVLDVKETNASLVNKGYDGITLRKGEKYDFSVFARVPEGNKGGKVNVVLMDKENNPVAKATVNVNSKTWKKLSVTLVPNANVSGGSIALQPQSAGRYELDMISLFPQNTFKNRKNGLRRDLAETLAALHPRFVRFPGGCVAHGDGIDNMYDWKGSIGKLEERKPLFNLWGYHQTRGLGYFEYFQFCEDIGAEPVPVLPAGVPCQNSGTRTTYSDTELGRYGQQCGIPMEQMGDYIQDILDLIEYANGDAKRTVWGRKRAEAGHPKPFNLKYIGIGNEDMITEVFEERFKMIYKAISEKHPEITVIGTVGPFYEGTDYDEGWHVAKETGVPVVDEHYYVSPGWMIHNQNYYDGYDRAKSKVYLGEYAAHLPGRPNNLETALAEALYLTSVERNADIVPMTSYAPLLAKDGHTQWNPDLIYFNNDEVRPTVGYYTQQMYGMNSGNKYLPSVVSFDNNSDAVSKRIGVSAVKDDKTGDFIVRLVNLLPVETTSNVTFVGAPESFASAEKTILTGSPTDRKAKSSTSPFDVLSNKFSYMMPPYSFTVIRFKSL